MKKIVLIDGHSILNRAFYGIPELTNSKGKHTNAVLGFLNIMFKVLGTENPDYLAVAFDLKAPTFRHVIYPEYKGNRKPAPEEFREQVPMIKELLASMNIPILTKEGYEADDILGTVAKLAQKNGMEATIVSGDRDLLQISDTNIKIANPKTKAGKTEVFYYYPDDVKAEYGVTPLEFVDVKALQGDTSDNIPGVPKIGPKTAVELICKYGNIEGIYEHIDEITKNSVKHTLSENKDSAFFCRKLVTIDINADIDFEFEDAVMGDFFNPDSFELFKEFELKSYFDRFSDVETKKKEMNVFVTGDSKEMFDWINKNIKSDFAFDFVIDSNNNEPVGQLSLFDTVSSDRKLCAAVLSVEDSNLFVHIDNFDVEKTLLDFVATYMTEGKGHIVTASAKSLFDLLKDYVSFDKNDAKYFTDGVFDAVIGAYLLNPLKNDYDAESVALEYGEDIPLFSASFGKKSYEDVYREDKDKFTDYFTRRNNALICAEGKLFERLEEKGLLKLFSDIEMPLSLVLFEMEDKGIICLPDELKKYSENLDERINFLDSEIKKLAGVDFNINSPKQLGEVLFEKLSLPGGKKTKTGYSTAADVLEKLAPENEIVAYILEYRGLTKLKSTYAEGLRGQIKEDGRIHTTFQQTVTATGRLSSTEPNLQNIPVRMEHGRLIRKVFVPKDGYIFMDSDYSQIELRVLAHMSNDKALIESYAQAEDIHSITASKVFGVPLNEVTPLMRRNAKAVNFGIVYGISNFGLSQDLSISRKEAQGYIEEYFKNYPGIKEFLDKTVKEAKENGFTRTLFGRIRPIPELSSSNFMQRSFGERVAMNSPIQGTAADIMKIAMIKVRDKLIFQKLESKILLQVHDEMLLEVKKEEEEKVKEILSSSMEQAANLYVPLDVDLHTGENWYDAK